MSAKSLAVEGARCDRKRDGGGRGNSELQWEQSKLREWRGDRSAEGKRATPKMQKNATNATTKPNKLTQ